MAIGVCEGATTVAGGSEGEFVAFLAHRPDAPFSRLLCLALHFQPSVSRAASLSQAPYTLPNKNTGSQAHQRSSLIGQQPTGPQVRVLPVSPCYITLKVSLTRGAEKKEVMYEPVTWSCVYVSAAAQNVEAGKPNLWATYVHSHIIKSNSTTSARLVLFSRFFYQTG